MFGESLQTITARLDGVSEHWQHSTVSFVSDIIPLPTFIITICPRVVIFSRIPLILEQFLPTEDTHSL